MFIVAYDIDGLILHHAVPPRQAENAAYYCMFVQHHIHLALRRKGRYLVVHNPIFLHDNEGVTLMTMGDSGTCIVLTRYESLRLRSLRQSEITIARDPV